jgi:hypothetical protein
MQFAPCIMHIETIDVVSSKSPHLKCIIKKIVFHGLMHVDINVCSDDSAADANEVHNIDRSLCDSFSSTWKWKKRKIYYNCSTTLCIRVGKRLPDIIYTLSTSQALAVRFLRKTNWKKRGLDQEREDCWRTVVVWWRRVLSIRWLPPVSCLARIITIFRTLSSCGTRNENLLER